MKLKKYLSIGVLVSSSSLLSGCSIDKFIHNIGTTEKELQSHEIIKNEVSVSAVGDVMIHKKQLDAQKELDGSYDFENNFRLIKEYIEKTDLSIANLETTINRNKNVSAYPSFNSPPEVLDTLKNTGFDIISTINNHSLDTGQSGVSSTIKEIKDRGLDYVGSQLTKDEKNYITKDINNIKFGIGSFSYADETSTNSFLNGIPSGNSKDLLNTIDKSNVEKAFNTIKKEIDLMKEENCEVIILNIHWGEEYSQTPSSYQKELAKLLINEGVDIIFGSHPHVVQPIETITSEDETHSGIVFYSLGNIISNQQEEEMGFKKSENGILPIVNFKKSEDKVEISDVKYIPTWVHRKPINSEKRYEYTIVPLIGDLDELATNEGINKSDLIISLEDTISVVNNENIKIYN